MAVVVLAEDDEDIRSIMARVLRRAGHTVVEAEDGVAGLAAVREHHPDMVVSDIDMPRMSGVELTLAIRADPRTKDLPVLFVSGSLGPGDSRPQQAQATAVMLKPFKSRELADCVQAVIDSGHGDGQPDECR